MKPTLDILQKCYPLLTWFCILEVWPSDDLPLCPRVVVTSVDLLMYPRGVIRVTLCCVTSVPKGVTQNVELLLYARGATLPDILLYPGGVTFCCLISVSKRCDPLLTYSWLLEVWPSVVLLLYPEGVTQNVDFSCMSEVRPSADLLLYPRVWPSADLLLYPRRATLCWLTSVS